jgi:uncharacterized protein
VTSVAAGAIAPTAEESRILSLDIARGLALCGILLMNITGFGLPLAYNDPTIAGGAEGADLWSWIITSMFFEGTQRGLFTLLFGAGVILLTNSLEKSTQPHASDAYFRRNLWLVLFGIVHAYLLLWTGEILFYYGVTALFVYGLRHAKTRTLIGLAAAGIALAVTWQGVETRATLKKHAAFVVADSAKTAGDSLNAEQTAAVTAWQGVLRGAKPDTARINREVRAKQGSYWDVLKFQTPQVMRFQSWWLYRFFYDYFAMMLLGMVLFRAGVLTAERSAKTYLLMILAGYGVGLSVNAYEVKMIIDGAFEPIAFARSAVTYDIGRIALTVGHVGLIMLWCRSSWFGAIKRAFGAVGRMAFTNYIMTSVICAIVFYGFGFGLFGELRRHQLYYVVGAIWIFQLIASPIWLKRYRFGPLEWLWRWLTYGAKPALRVTLARGPRG